eukprot:CAMPEP_0195527332 /NCGR_PEP_ID=MMETSP0794_2-20130614/28937_1 /TAXON_ID=515487 /ORGANISM="Stephanopyxis turris, Strain CCMP 815" /LENGTH=369 /DNA_ID=CAMNT_0040658221 /DNA_START=51 /DNA_END=1160 /DNA_ORIENTATION=+
MTICASSLIHSIDGFTASRLSSNVFIRTSSSTADLKRIANHYEYNQFLPYDHVSSSCLYAAKGDGGGSKKRRRKRKKPVVETPTIESEDVDAVMDEPIKSVSKGVEAQTEAQPAAASKPFSFNRAEAEALGIEDGADDEEIPMEFAGLAGGDSAKMSSPQALPKLSNAAAMGKGAMELPDIRDVVKQKKITQNKKEEEQEVEEDAKELINRRDKKSLKKLMEVDPNADTDMSIYEEEEYGTVSALLGEGALTFLGLPLPILQIGHFIGSLGLILCAFIYYPGFPLTNLPSPLRAALQGGLGTIYLINVVLAIFAAFAAGERNQPKGLWVAKTLTVGGLAFDQLTQLPTTAQVEEMKSRKGARAMKNRKR